MKYKLTNARDIAKRDLAAGNAAKYILPFDRLRSDDKVLLVVCVSTYERATKQKNHLKDQERNLRRQVESAGGVVVGVWNWVGSRYDSLCVFGARVMAKRVDATVLLAESTDRLVRNLSYHSSERPNYQATEAQLRDVAECAGETKLMTHLDPGASPRHVRSYQRKRGQWAKGRRGGRPMRRRYAPRYSSWPKAVRRVVRRLHRKGWTVRKIASSKKLARLLGQNPSKSSVQRFLSQFAT